MGPLPHVGRGARRLEYVLKAPYFVNMRPKMQIMSLTEAAAKRIGTLLSAMKKAGLRVGVKNGGCAGMSYTIEALDWIDPKDELIEDKGVQIYIDPKAVLFLLGTELDYKTEKLKESFVFNNPNQTGACGCGESISLQPAQVKD